VALAKEGFCGGHRWAGRAVAVGAYGALGGWNNGLVPLHPTSVTVAWSVMRPAPRPAAVRITDAWATERPAAAFDRLPAYPRGPIRFPAGIPDAAYLDVTFVYRRRPPVLLQTDSCVGVSPDGGWPQDRRIHTRRLIDPLGAELPDLLTTGSQGGLGAG